MDWLDPKNVVDAATAGSVVAVVIKWRGIISGAFRLYDKLTRNGHGGATDSKIYQAVERRLDGERQVRIEQKLDGLDERLDALETMLARLLGAPISRVAGSAVESANQEIGAPRGDA